MKGWGGGRGRDMRSPYSLCNLLPRSIKSVSVCLSLKCKVWQLLFLPWLSFACLVLRRPSAVDRTFVFVLSTLRCSGREYSRRLVSELVIWYFEPSQTQRITSGLKLTSICLLFNSAHKSSNYTFSNKHKISPDTKFI